MNKDLPYYEISEAPKEFTAGTIVSRTIDGLGFRFYWATEDLKENDLAYRSNDEVRSTGETIAHIYDLSNTILNCAKKFPNDKYNPTKELTIEEKRIQALLNLKEASDIFRTVKDLANHKIIFKKGEDITEYPFWNQLNGPIADAIWHSGQIASFRRSSGNPINPNINVFNGTVKG